MDIQFLIDAYRAVRIELYRHKWAAMIIFMTVTLGVLAAGYLIPKSYTSEAVLYADETSALQPLLKDKAELANLDRINQARQLMQSRPFLEQVAMDAGLITGGESDAARSEKIKELRNQVGIKVSNKNFLGLSYTSASPEESFQVLSAVLSRFVERTLQKNRSDSRGAYEFIGSQVETYQRQLEEAEQRVKNFKITNHDGTEGNVLTRLESLRREIENLKLEIQQTESEIELTRTQLEGEQPVRRISMGSGQSAAEQRLAKLRQERDSLLLRFYERHPDVVSIQSQIADLEERVASGTATDVGGGPTEVMENPLYENLKIQLSESTTRLEVQKNRLASLRRLLDETFVRSQRVAENETQLSELTRDYAVTRNVYEDMLQSREKARLSMVLNVQGEGASYQIQEPASYPTRWDGLQLYQFGLAGPFMGSAVVLGLLVMLVMFDQRVRSPNALQLALPESIPLLTTIPHYHSTWKDRLLRKDVLTVLIVLAVFMIAYLAFVVFSVMNLSPEQLMEKAGALTGRVSEGAGN